MLCFVVGVASSSVLLFLCVVIVSAVSIDALIGCLRVFVWEVCSVMWSWSTSSLESVTFSALLPVVILDLDLLGTVISAARSSDLMLLLFRISVVSVMTPAVIGLVARKITYSQQQYLVVLLPLPLYWCYLQ